MSQIGFPKNHFQKSGVQRVYNDTDTTNERLLSSQQAGRVQVCLTHSTCLSAGPPTTSHVQKVVVAPSCEHYKRALPPPPLVSETQQKREDG